MRTAAWSSYSLGCGKKMFQQWSPLSVLIDLFREMAHGNTFGATAFSSYGGFWIAYAIILTPGKFGVVDVLTADGSKVLFFDSFGLFLMVLKKKV